MAEGTLDGSTEKASDNETGNEENVSKMTNANSKDIESKNLALEEQWSSIISTNKKLQKRVKRKGRGSHSKPEILQTVNLSYRLFLSSGELAEEKNNIDIFCRDSDVIEGLDFAVSHMEEGEVAELRIPAELAYGSQGRLPKIPPLSDLMCDVEVHKVSETPDEDSLSFEERLRLGLDKKASGNLWYSQKNYVSAIHCYRRALDVLDTNIKTLEAPEDELQRMLEERVVVYNNLAAAQLQIQAFDAVLKSVDTVLKFQPYNTKAMYRKSKAYQGKGAIEECIKLLHKAVKMSPNSTELQQELKSILNLKKKSVNKEKQLYRKMLGLEETIIEDSNRKINLWTVAVGTILFAAIGCFTAHHFTTNANL